jgi:hypothetical protein
MPSFYQDRLGANAGKVEEKRVNAFSGQTRMLLDGISLPLGYFFLYRLYGVAAIGVSIVANVVITAITARLTTQKSISQGKLRELSKKQVRKRRFSSTL